MVMRYLVLLQPRHESFIISEPVEITPTSWLSLFRRYGRVDLVLQELMWQAVVKLRQEGIEVGRVKIIRNNEAMPTLI
jgi:hypothetical protein